RPRHLVRERGGPRQDTLEDLRAAARRGFQAPAFLGRQRVGPPAQRGANALRKRQRLRQHRLVVEVALAASDAQHLVEEEGIAVGQVVQPRDQGRRRGGGRDSRDEGLDRRPAEAAKPDAPPPLPRVRERSGRGGGGGWVRARGAGRGSSSGQVGTSRRRAPRSSRTTKASSVSEASSAQWRSSSTTRSGICLVARRRKAATASRTRKRACTS